jgi:hypothetical protein
MNAGSLLGSNYNWEEGPPYIDSNDIFWPQGSQESGILAGGTAYMREFSQDGRIHEGF